jgi:hypothetical protein
LTEDSHFFDELSLNASQQHNWIFCCIQKCSKNLGCRCLHNGLPEVFDTSLYSYMYTHHWDLMSQWGAMAAHCCYSIWVTVWCFVSYTHTVMSYDHTHSCSVCFLSNHGFLFSRFLFSRG